jgi:hypothetical protein
MSAPDFAAWFAADLPVEEIPFTIAGRAASVSLRAMDQSTKDTFEMKGARLEQQLQAGTVADNAADSLKRFLVANTVVDWSIPVERDSAEGKVWQNEGLPQKPSERERAILNFKGNALAWEWLLEECKRVNGYTEPEAKNETTPCVN